MTKINAYLAFKGNCREAMTFYKACIGGELTMQTIVGSPIEADCPPEMKNMILHARLTKGELSLLGSDMSEQGQSIVGNVLSLCLNCSSDEEVNRFFARLSEGGKITDPLSVKFWGATFGVLTDRYGTRWMLVYDKNQK